MYSYFVVYIELYKEVSIRRTVLKTDFKIDSEESIRRLENEMEDYLNLSCCPMVINFILLSES